MDWKRERQLRSMAKRGTEQAAPRERAAPGPTRTCPERR